MQNQRSLYTLNRDVWKAGGVGPFLPPGNGKGLRKFSVAWMSKGWIPAQIVEKYPILLQKIIPKCSSSGIFFVWKMPNPPKQYVICITEGIRHLFAFIWIFAAFKFLKGGWGPNTTWGGPEPLGGGGGPSHHLPRPHIPDAGDGLCNQFASLTLTTVSSKIGRRAFSSIFGILGQKKNGAKGHKRSVC